MSSPAGGIHQLLAEALTAADDAAVPVSVLARKAMRIARLRNDWENQWWLQMEMLTIDDTRAKSGKVLQTASAEIRPHMTQDEYNAMGDRIMSRFFHGPRIMEDEKLLPTGIADTEARAEAIETHLGSLQLPPGSDPQHIFHQTQHTKDLTVKLNNALLQCRSVLMRQRDAIGDYLSKVETQLHFGAVTTDMFERNREYVDRRLAAVAPQVLEQFAAAYERQADGDGEARSHALLSCRRVLKSFADALYPATGAEMEGLDGNRRIMSDDGYINRLCQYAADATAGSASRDLIVESVEALGRKLKRLNSLSSKAVHADVSAAELDQCIMQTYLVVGDLLRLADDRSAALA
jgi:hypothetical protein